MSRFYRAIYWLLSKPVRAIWRVRTEGIENIPEKGCILVANHTAFSDVIVLEVAQKRQIRFMAKKELFKIPLLSALIKALGAYPVDRGGADIKSLKNTFRMIEDGDIVGIFPQGTRCPNVDPRDTEVKGGIGMIAYHAKADILPVFIDNKGKTRSFSRNTVRIGKLIPFEQLGFDKGGRAEYDRVAKHIFSKVCELKYGEGNGYSEKESSDGEDQNS